MAAGVWGKCHHVTTVHGKSDSESNMLNQMCQKLELKKKEKKRKEEAITRLATGKKHVWLSEISSTCCAITKLFGSWVLLCWRQCCVLHLHCSSKQHTHASCLCAGSFTHPRATFSAACQQAFTLDILLWSHYFAHVCGCSSESHIPCPPSQNR